MKALIRVKRLTEYASIVEMTRADYLSIKHDLHSANPSAMRAAEKRANNLIDTNDWQDDELQSIEEFEEHKEITKRTK
jgi:hypothetical protein